MHKSVRRRAVRSLPLGALAALAAACGDETRAPEANLAITNVTVVDVTTGALQAKQTILISGARIVDVMSADESPPPTDATVMDGQDGYLIPGLWDAHVHSAGAADWHFPLYLAHGVTTVRNMHAAGEDPLALTNEIKRQLATGERVGPRFLANGGLVDGVPPVWSGSVAAGTAEEARAAVDRLADGGADFIKVYDRLSREPYFTLMKQANLRGIPVDGHVPFLVKPEEAAAAGQRTVEHTSGVALGCSAGADRLRDNFVRYLNEVPNMPPYPDAMVAFFELVRQAIDTRDPELCMRTAHAYLEHGVAVVPTLVANAGSDSQAFLADPARMAMLPQSVREQWVAIGASGPDPIETLLGPVDSAIIENVRMLNETGVAILAGTDVGNPFLVPGLSLHRELARLTEAGLTPLQALQAATLQPARVFGLDVDLGTIEAGKFADLVLLGANPLEDIAGTQRIRAVVANGRLYRRADLDAFLAKAARVEESGGPAAGE